MAKNPIVKGSGTIGMDMKETMAAELERRPDLMHLSVSTYGKLVFGAGVR